MKLHWVAVIAVIAFAVGHYTVPEPEPKVVTEYKDIKYPFEPVNKQIHFSYNEDQNKLTVRKTGLKDLDFGDSMQPTMWAGNLYLTTAYTGQELEPGMIVGAYRPDKDEVWVHRIDSLGVKGNGQVWTQGDNNEGNSELVNKSNIRYIVTGVLYTDKSIDGNPNNYTNTWKDRDNQ